VFFNCDTEDKCFTDRSAEKEANYGRGFFCKLENLRANKQKFQNGQAKNRNSKNGRP
jgi:hypothetical protein